MNIKMHSAWISCKCCTGFVYSYSTWFSRFCTICRVASQATQLI